jgi:anaerobic selenocysteine-containing dehydrogenase
MIRQAAAALGSGRPVAYYCWTGVAQHANASQTDRAIAILMALTGSIDAPGGNVEFARAPVDLITGAQFLGSEQRAKTLGAAARPLGPAAVGAGVPAADIYRAILDHKPYPVRGLVAFGTNMLLTRANPQRAAAALQALDFCVHADPVPNSSSAFADILLPVNNQWEREGLCVSFGVNEAGSALVQLRPQAVPSLGESRSDMWIAFQLAQRLGFGDDFWNGDLDAAIDHQLAPAGLSLAQLRASPGGATVRLQQRRLRHTEPVAGGFRGFETPTRLVELHSELLAAHGYDALPNHVPRAHDARFPLVLTNAKVPHYCQSQHRDIPALRQRMPEPLLEVHPETAAARRINDGDWVAVVTARGRAHMRARVSATLDPAVVCGHFGWTDVGPKPDMANFAALIDDTAADPISGTVTHRGIACEVVLTKA